jgi:phosphotriesterase-related protein
LRIIETDLRYLSIKLIKMRKPSIILLLVISVFMQACNRDKGEIMTVKGIIPASEMGITLTHEHVLVDFIGADAISYDRWKKPEVIRKVIPYLFEAKKRGCKTFIDCTPQYIGRDPLLLRALSDSTGLNIMTNTGYYGAGNDKYIPAHAYFETADQLAARWTDEWNNGIEGTGIKPGFIKIGVGPGELSELHRKLVQAAARTHLKTGLTIASHSGKAVPAFAQLGVLREEGVSAEAFIWVHAQAENDSLSYIMAAKAGAWVSFDGISEDNANEYLRLLKFMKSNKMLNKVLLSHDAGWFRPEVEGGGDFRGFTALFDKLLPLLRKEGFTEKEINQLLVLNPSKAFAVRKRPLK